MLLHKIIQNYYEVHGTFDKIEVTPIGDSLRSLSKHYNASIPEVCCQYLGIQPKVIRNKQYSAYLIFNSLILYYKNDLETLQSLLEVNSLSELNILLKEFGVKESSSLICTDYTEEILQAGILLSQYYESLVPGYITIENNGKYSLTFLEYVEYLSTFSKRDKDILTKILNDKEIKSKLITIKPTDGKTRVENNILFVPISIHKNEYGLIQRAAIHCLLGNPCINLQMMPVKSNLPFLPEEDSWLYVDLLAVSTALGVTYADLLKEFFINIEDKMNQFTEKGYLLFIINGEEYLYNAECTNGPIKPKELGLTADAIQAAYENKVTKIKEQLQKQNSANKINSMEVFK